jgi:hypothetical protein
MTDVTYTQRNVTAAADLSAQATRYKAISVAGTIAASALRAAGVLVTSTNSGHEATVRYKGEFKAQFGAGVTTAGYPLTVTTSGFITAAVSGGYAIGQSIAAATSGDIARALFDFSMPHYWAG